MAPVIMELGDGRRGYGQHGDVASAKTEGSKEGNDGSDNHDTMGERSPSVGTILSARMNSPNSHNNPMKLILL